MDKQFWQDRWTKNQIAFHNPEAHPLLVRHFDAVVSKKAPHVFVPLCGKSLDLVWLAEQGCTVTGAELSELAVQQFFDELGIQPHIAAAGALTRYEGNGITIYQGSVFDVTADMLGPVDLVYDRAALVALPETMREQYARHLRETTQNATQLLICYEYDQSCSDGPPFSVDEAEVRRQYAATYELTLLERSDVAGGLKGKCPATEAVWQLRTH